MKSTDFLGLTKKRAQDLAEGASMIFRLIRIDTEPYLAYPDDIRTDRICVEIDAGTVTKATVL